MSDETGVFVDTSILVYAFDDSDSVRRAVAERALLELMESDRIRLSTHVLQEFYVAVTGRGVGNPLSPSVALAILDELSAWPILVVDYGLVRETVLLSKAERLPFGDALLITAAARSGAETLYTDSPTLGQALLSVRIVNPLL